MDRVVYTGKIGRPKKAPGSPVSFLVPGENNLVWQHASKNEKSVNLLSGQNIKQSCWLIFSEPTS
jgi:hypothetical protein